MQFLSTLSKAALKSMKIMSDTLKYFSLLFEGLSESEYLITSASVCFESRLILSCDTPVCTFDPFLTIASSILKDMDRRDMLR